jgi:hypothetical protein
MLMASETTSAATPTTKIAANELPSSVKDLRCAWSAPPTAPVCSPV